MQLKNSLSMFTSWLRIGQRRGTPLKGAIRFPGAPFPPAAPAFRPYLAIPEGAGSFDGGGGIPLVPAGRGTPEARAEALFIGPKVGSGTLGRPRDAEGPDLLDLVASKIGTRLGPDTALTLGKEGLGIPFSSVTTGRGSTSVRAKVFEDSFGAETSDEILVKGGEDFR